MANDKNFIVKDAVEVGGSDKTTVGTITSGSVGYYLAGASYDSVSFDVSSQSTQPGDVVFSSDGTKMYINNQAGSSSSVEQYNLSTAYDISTASHSSADSLTVGTQDTSPFLFLSPPLSNPSSNENEADAGGGVAQAQKNSI